MNHIVELRAKILKYAKARKHASAVHAILHLQLRDQPYTAIARQRLFHTRNAMEFNCVKIQKLDYFDLRSQMYKGKVRQKAKIHQVSGAICILALFSFFLKNKKEGTAVGLHGDQ